MNEFRIDLSEEQFFHIQSLLPKGYCLKKAKGRPNKVKFPEEGSSSGCSNYEQQTNNESYGHTFSKPRSTTADSAPTRRHNHESPTVTHQKGESQIQKNKLYMNMLQQIQRKRSADIFIQPVDPVELQIPTYFEIIKQPMDIETMKKKVETQSYGCFKDIQKDLEQIVWNCLKFNAQNQAIIKMAKKFEKDWKLIVEGYKKNFQSLEISRQLSEEPQEKEQIKPPSTPSKVQKKKLKSQAKTLTSEQVKKPICTEGSNKIKIESTGKNEQKSIEKKRTKNDSLPRISKVQDKKGQICEKDLTSNISIEKNDKTEQSKLLSPIRKVKNQSHDQSPKTEATRTKKKYNYQQRLRIIERIRKLDKSSMAIFFGEIQFGKGEVLDFKLLEDERLATIEGVLHKTQRALKQNLEQAERDIQKSNGKNWEFEMAEDDDYKD